MQASSSDFDEESKIKAKAFSSTLKAPRFLTTLIFLIDGLDRLHLFSKMLQEKIGIVIGKELDRRGLIQSIKNLRDNNGVYLMGFLDEAKCFSELTWKKCRINDLDEKAAKILFKDIILQDSAAINRRTDRANEFLSLQELRTKFSELVSEEIESYFPDGELKMFDIFDSTNIPSDKGLLLDHRSLELFELCKFFKMDHVEVAKKQVDLFSETG